MEYIMKTEIDRLSNNLVLRKKSDGSWVGFIPNDGDLNTALSCRADRASTVLQMLATRARLLEEGEAEELVTRNRCTLGTMRRL